MKKKKVFVEAGESRVFCKGKLVTGPDRLYFYFAFLMTLLPTAAFMAFVYVVL